MRTTPVLEAPHAVLTIHSQRRTAMATNNHTPFNGSNANPEVDQYKKRLARRVWHCETPLFEHEVTDDATGEILGIRPVYPGEYLMDRYRQDTFKAGRVLQRYLRLLQYHKQPQHILGRYVRDVVLPEVE